jgi:hypothetical protein
MIIFAYYYSHNNQKRGRSCFYYNAFLNLSQSGFFL